MNRKLSKVKNEKDGLQDKKHKGLDYIYRIIAGEKLNRTLKRSEVVHHLDLDSENNDPSNLIVFHSQSEHRRFHAYNCNKNHLKQLDDGSYVTEFYEYICEYCHKTFYSAEKRKSDHIYCSQECAKNNRTTNSLIPSKEELEKLVWSSPSSIVAKKFNVSDKSIEKWCKKYGLEKPGRGYWQKKASAK